MNSKLIRWLPKRSIKNQSNILPVFRGLYSQNIPQKESENIELLYDSRTVKLEYAYPVFNKEENNEFRVFLKGQDIDTRIGQVHLLENTQTYQKKIMNFSFKQETLMVMKGIYFYSFTILPPWYRTYAAYASYLILLAFGFRAFGKYQAKKSLEQADNERRAGELEEAKKIQQSMLPKVFPSSKPFDVSAGLVTSTEIGGDYYDFFEKKDTFCCLWRCHWSWNCFRYDGINY